MDYAASFIQWFAEQAKRANGEIIPPVKPGSRILATREPVGVVAAITPWNFPMAMLTVSSAGAGSRMYRRHQACKQHAAERLCAADAGEAGRCAGWCAECGRGSTSEISDAIMASHDVRKISFYRISRRQGKRWFAIPQRP